MNSRVPVPTGTRALREPESEDAELVEARPLAWPFSAFGFRYTVTEVSLSEGRTRIRSHTTRLQDGKLESESFEGELEPAAYEQAVRQATEQFLGLTAQLWRSLPWLRPFGPRGDGKG